MGCNYCKDGSCGYCRHQSRNYRSQTMEESTCRHCGLAIEAMNPPNPTWIHSQLSIYCMGSARRLVAEPIEEQENSNGI